MWSVVWTEVDCLAVWVSARAISEIYIIEIWKRTRSVYGPYYVLLSIGSRVLLEHAVTVIIKGSANLSTTTFPSIINAIDIAIHPRSMH